MAKMKTRRAGASVRGEQHCGSEETSVRGVCSAHGRLGQRTTISFVAYTRQKSIPRGLHPLAQTSISVHKLPARSITIYSPPPPLTRLNRYASRTTDTHGLARTRSIAACVILCVQQCTSTSRHIHPSMTISMHRFSRAPTHPPKRPHDFNSPEPSLG